MAEFDPNAFTPSRAALQMLIARGLFSPLYGIYHRLKVSGRQNVPRSGPLLVVSNHLSFLDPPLLLIACDRPMAYLAKVELFRMPLLKHFIKFSGAISLNRAHPGLATFKEVKEIFKQGWALSVFIEGTRNRHPGVLALPHLGPAYIAHLNNVPVLPVGIVGTDKPWGKAAVRIGKIIQPQDNLADTTWKIMEKLSELTGFTLPPRKLSRRRRQRRAAAIRLAKRR